MQNSNYRWRLKSEWRSTKGIYCNYISCFYELFWQVIIDTIVAWDGGYIWALWILGFFLVKIRATAGYLTIFWRSWCQCFWKLLGFNDLRFLSWVFKCHPMFMREKNLKDIDLVVLWNELWDAICFRKREFILENI